jgi:predicted ATP-grasp superfamily ATP-dependent carboligase
MDKKRPIVYITRDIERALGVDPSDSYIVISNDNAQGKLAKAAHPEGVKIIADSRGTLDTFDLMSLPQVANEIESRDANVVVFQNNPRIERLAIERGWRLVNPLAELAKRIEEKVSQVSWLNEDAKLLPPHMVAKVKEVSFEGKKFVLQFNHSHTGQGTFIIESAEQLNEFKAKFPDRECRIVDFVEGPVFTMNVAVGETETILGATSYQITGLEPFTDLPFSTIGNDWGLPRAVVSDVERGAIDHIARVIAERMRKEGWRGLFGIDVVQDAKTRDIFLLEINARQPASAVFESTLQREAGMSPTIFEAHIAALTGEACVPGTSADSKAGRISDGAQIVSRVTKEPRAVDVQALSARGLSVTTYENAEHNKELFRIQSNKGIMSAHNTLGELGTFIRSCIK